MPPPPVFTALEHAASLGIDAEVVACMREAGGFHMLKRPWTVERTFGWLMLQRRLARPRPVCRGIAAVRPPVPDPRASDSLAPADRGA